MYPKLMTYAAAALLLASPAFATTMASGAVTPAKAATHLLTRRLDHVRPITASTRGEREIKALNALAAAGYRQFDDLHAQGKDFVTTATKSGKHFDVTITPSGQIETKSA